MNLMKGDEDLNFAIKEHFIILQQKLFQC